MFSLRHFTSYSFIFALTKWIIFSLFRNSLCSNLLALFIEHKYFVFISSVEICIYMFNKTRYDLLLPEGLIALVLACVVKSRRITEKAEKKKTCGSHSETGDWGRMWSETKVSSWGVVSQVCALIQLLLRQFSVVLLLAENKRCIIVLLHYNKGARTVI